MNTIEQEGKVYSEYLEERLNERDVVYAEDIKSYMLKKDCRKCCESYERYYYIKERLEHHDLGYFHGSYIRDYRVVPEDGKNDIFYNADDLFYDELNGCWYITPKSIVKPHSYKPKRIFHGDGNQYFGIEVEVHNVLQEAFSFQEILDKLDFYMKEDSTLNDGIEFVSHPFTENWFEENKDNIKKLLEKIQECGGSCNNESGLHIHISRIRLTDLQIRAMEYFINKNKDFWIKISGRENTSHSKYKTEKIKNIIDIPFSKDKYTALNLSPSQTIEIRTYQSTLNHTELFCRIQSAFALTSFCANKKRVKDLTVNKFIDYVHSNKSRFNYLSQFLDT